MKRFVLILILTVIISTLGACKSENSSNITPEVNGIENNGSPNEATNMKASENTSRLPQKSTDTQNFYPTKASHIQDSGKTQEINKDNTDVNKKELFFGEWTITKNIANNKVSAYSKDEIEKMIGKKVTYSDTLASFDNNICSSPSYKKMTIITKEEDEKNYVKFADLGIKIESIINIEVFANKEQSKSWISAGSLFYVKDQNTLIMVDDGAFFELTRSK